MTRDELIKAARNCTSIGTWCDGCPLYKQNFGTGVCVDTLITALADELERRKKMIDLINRTELLQQLNECIAVGDNSTTIATIINTALAAVRSAVEQMPSVEGIQWHEIKTRPLTDDEKAMYAKEGFEPEFAFDCVMPGDGDEILIATEFGVDKDICSSDFYGVGLEGRDSFDGVLAWAEMPVYRKGRNDDQR